jgi:hypothetical protein
MPRFLPQRGVRSLPKEVVRISVRTLADVVTGVGSPRGAATMFAASSRLRTGGGPTDAQRDDDVFRPAP